ncbi:ArgE/DapE family deacylase [Vagococcus sp. BWB3-3]|uniref:Probable succinyl-diaminopimelate desuccinylase n=1 Tax=Vagococcus allomyrinae TaxID=2794353 RepID=A0A940PD71_9ENTE|nr:ArgE/DapE family deacylase [Vagococcus allomyrinae]MBP1043921.1 ArgE/DapE family deacylase [Vagococcus allomyrinae]
MNNEEALDLLKDIVRTETVLGKEQLIADKLATLFSAHDIPSEKVIYSEGRHQLVVTLEGAQPGPVLGFSGHMDVVPIGEVPWVYEPFAAVEKEGLLHGRGTCDMKAGLIAQVVALIRLKEEGVRFKGKIKLLITIGEETAAIGAKQLTDLGYADDLDGLIIGEPSSLDVVIAHKGALWPQLTTYGKTAHGSMPQLGINAIDHMLHVLNQFKREFDFSTFSDELLGESTASLNVFQGGNGANVVPDKCVATIDIRTVPGQSHEELKNAINHLIKNASEAIPDFKGEVAYVNDLPAIRTEKDHPFTKLAIDAVKKVAQKEPEVKSLTGYTDGSEFGRAKKDFPILIVGPGDVRLAHQPNENVPIEQFFQMIEVNGQIAKAFLS